jgi:hypothetical protein
LVFYVSGETKGQMNIVVKRKNFQRDFHTICQYVISMIK